MRVCSLLPLFHTASTPLPLGVLELMPKGINYTEPLYIEIVELNKYQTMLDRAIINDNAG